MSTSRLIAEVEIRNGELAIHQLKGVAAATDDVGSSSSKASKGLEDEEKHTKKLSKASENWLGVSAKVATGLGVLYAGYKGVKEAINFESQTKNAENTLKNLHENHSGHLAAMEGNAKKASETGGFSREEEFAGISKALGVTHNATKAIEAHSNAVDLAREKGIALATAETAVNQALVGKTGRLQKLMGIIQPYTKYATELATKEKENKSFVATDAEKKHAQLLDQEKTREEALMKVREQSKSAMATYAHSLKGEWEDLKHTVQNFIEELGKGLIPILKTVVGDGMKVIAWIKSNWTWFKYLAGAALLVTGAIVGINKAQKAYKDIQTALSGATKAYTKVMALFTGATEAQTAATDETTTSTIALDAATGGILLGIGLLIVGIVELIKHWKTVKEVAIDAFKWILHAITSVWNWIKKNWPLLLAILLFPISPVLAAFVLFHKQIIGIFEEVVHWIETAFNNVLNFLESIPGKIVNAFEKLPGKILGILKKIPGVGSVIGIAESVFHTGGLVQHATQRHLHFAPGGIVPGYGSSDSIPAMLTPGEFVLRKQAVSAIGVGTLERVNAQGGIGAGAGGGEEFVPIQIINKLDSRVLSESVAKYVLKRRRGAPGAFAGPGTVGPSLAGAL